jgi:hypothetical protein
MREQKGPQVEQYTNKDFAKDIVKAVLQSLLAQALAWAALLGLGFAASKYYDRKNAKK